VTLFGKLFGGVCTSVTEAGAEAERPGCAEERILEDPNMEGIKALEEV